MTNNFYVIAYVYVPCRLDKNSDIAGWADYRGDFRIEKDTAAIYSTRREARWAKKFCDFETMDETVPENIKGKIKPRIYKLGAVKSIT